MVHLSVARTSGTFHELAVYGECMGVCVGSACEEVVSVCWGRGLENHKAGVKRKLAHVKRFSEFTLSALLSFRRNKKTISFNQCLL